MRGGDGCSGEQGGEEETVCLAPCDVDPVDEGPRDRESSVGSGAPVVAESSKTLPDDVPVVKAWSVPSGGEEGRQASRDWEREEWIEGISGPQEPEEGGDAETERCSFSWRRRGSRGTSCWARSNMV